MVSARTLPEQFAGGSNCAHEFRIGVEERWAVAAEREGSIGSCVCCWGPLVQVMAAALEFNPAWPADQYIGTKDRCARCPE